MRRADHSSRGLLVGVWVSGVLRRNLKSDAI